MSIIDPLIKSEIVTFLSAFSTLLSFKNKPHCETNLRTSPRDLAILDFTTSSLNLIPSPSNLFLVISVMLEPSSASKISFESRLIKLPWNSALVISSAFSSPPGPCINVVKFAAKSFCAILFLGSFNVDFSNNLISS